jgi:hypothetical protein
VGNSSVTLFAKVNRHNDFRTRNFACVSSAPLRSIAMQLRIRERQLRFGVDPKMKSADADAQKKE